MTLFIKILLYNRTDYLTYEKELRKVDLSIASILKILLS